VPRVTASAFEARQEFGNFEANLAFLDATHALAAGLAILEIGSGSGGMLHTLRSRGLDVQGVEVSEDRIRESRERYGDLPLTRIDGRQLPFPDARFDLVLSFDVFEHIPDSDAHLTEVRRVLRPGGSYLLQTPNKWTNVMFETVRWRSFTAFRVDHCSLHTRREITRRFDRHGFDVQFFDVPVVTDFFRRKIRHYLGAPGSWAIRLVNPDRLPRGLRPNLFVRARLRPVDRPVRR
jgi:SAM-dependent methyltransferase